MPNALDLAFGEQAEKPNALDIAYPGRDKSFQADLGKAVNTAETYTAQMQPGAPAVQPTRAGVLGHGTYARDQLINMPGGGPASREEPDVGAGLGLPASINRPRPGPDITDRSALGEFKRLAAIPLIPGPQISEEQMPEGVLGKSYAMAFNKVMEKAGGLTSLDNAALLGALPFVPATAAPIIDAYFIGQMGPAAYEQAKQGVTLLHAGKIPEAVAQFTGAGFDTGFVAMMLKSAKGKLDALGPSEQVKGLSDILTKGPVETPAQTIEPLTRAEPFRPLTPQPPPVFTGIPTNVEPFKEAEIAPPRVPKAERQPIVPSGVQPQPFAPAEPEGPPRPIQELVQFDPDQKRYRISTRATLNELKAGLATVTKLAEADPQGPMAALRDTLAEEIKNTEQAPSKEFPVLPATSVRPAIEALLPEDQVAELKFEVQRAQRFAPGRAQEVLDAFNRNDQEAIEKFRLEEQANRRKALALLRDVPDEHLLQIMAPENAIEIRNGRHPNPFPRDGAPDIAALEWMRRRLPPEEPTGQPALPKAPKPTISPGSSATTPPGSSSPGTSTVTTPAPTPKMAPVEFQSAQEYPGGKKLEFYHVRGPIEGWTKEQGLSIDRTTLEKLGYTVPEAEAEKARQAFEKKPAVPPTIPPVVPIEGVGSTTQTPTPVVDTSKPHIVASAVRPIGLDKTMMGANHPVIDKSLNRPETEREQRNTYEYGFIVDDGKGNQNFVTRAVAGQIAKANGQAVEDFPAGHEIHSDELWHPTEPGKKLGEVDRPVEEFIQKGRSGRPRTQADENTLLGRLLADGIRIRIPESGDYKEAVRELLGIRIQGGAQKFWKQLFTKQGGIALDEATAYAANRDWIDRENGIDSLLGTLRAEAESRQHSPEAPTLEEKQLDEFAKAAFQNPKGKEKIEPTTLNVGDKFTLKGENFKVTEIDVDPDGKLRGVTVKDGRKFGTQELGADDTFQVDKGSLLQPPGEEPTVEPAATPPPTVAPSGGQTTVTPEAQGLIDEKKKLVAELGDPYADVETPPDNIKTSQQESPGFSPRDWEKHAKLAAGAIAEKGINQDQFEKALRKKYGFDVEPYLLKIWNHAVDLAQKAKLEAEHDRTGELKGETTTEPVAGRPERESDRPTRSGSVRPGLFTADAGRIPNPTEYVSDKDYNGYPDKHQRLGINVVLTARANGHKGALLSDGVGVGKSATILGVLDNIAKETGKPVLLIVPKTLRDQVSEGYGSFVEASKAMGINLSRFEIGSYDDLRLGKAGKRQYAAAVFDEAHQFKNFDSQRSAAGRAVNADYRIYSTATPLDKPLGAAYFVHHATGEPLETVMQRFGIEFTPKLTEDGEPILNEDGSPKMDVKPMEGLSWKDVKKNMIRERGNMIGRGTFLRREYPFFGDIVQENHEMTLEQSVFHKEWLKWWDNKIESARGRYKLMMKGQKTLEGRRYAETLKIDLAENTINDFLTGDKPGKIIIVGEGVNETDIKGLEKLGQPQILGELSRRLEKSGTPFAKIYGGKSVAGEIKKFQEDPYVRVALMNTKKGGVGVSLDDVQGTEPRHVHVFSMDMGGDNIDQLHGRFSRRNSESPTTVTYHFLSGHFGDQKSKAIGGSKLEALRLIQRGEDPDVARPLFDESGGLVKKQSSLEEKTRTVGIARDVAQDATQRIAAKLNTKIEVVHSDEIAETHPGIVRAGSEGFFDPTTGRAVVVHDQVHLLEGETPEQSVIRVALHELVGHKGLAALRDIDPQFEREFQMLARKYIPRDELDALSQGPRAPYRKYADWKTNRDSFNKVAEEWFAREAEVHGNRPFVKRLVDSVVRTIRRLFPEAFKSWKAPEKWVMDVLKRSKGALRSAESAKSGEAMASEKPKEPEPLKLESVTDKQLLKEKEQAAKKAEADEAKAKLEEARTKKLKGTTGDLGQKDMFGKRELFESKREEDKPDNISELLRMKRESEQLGSPAPGKGSEPPRRPPKAPAGAPATPEGEPSKVPKALQGVTDVQAVKTLQKAIEENRRGIQDTLAPSTVSEEAGKSAQIVSRMSAERALKIQQVETAAENGASKTDRMSNEKMDEMWANWESGGREKDQTIAATQDLIRTELDHAAGELVKRKALNPETIINLETQDKEYLGRQWQDPEKASQVIGQMLARRPLRGDRAFLKKRSLEWYREGIEAGLVPKIRNPIRAQMERLRSMYKLISAIDGLTREREAGHVAFKRVFDKMPEGYARVDDPAFKVFGPPTIATKEYVDESIYSGLTDFMQNMGIKYSRDPRIGGTRLGYYQPSGDIIKARANTPLSVIYHELGHWIGEHYQTFEHFTKKMEGKYPTKAKALIERELRAVADLHGFRKEYFRKAEEKEASLLEAFLQVPDDFQRVAPNLYREWEQFLGEHPELHPLTDLKSSMKPFLIEHEVPHGGLLQYGEYVLPAESAKIWNNYLSPGLARYGWYRGLRSAGNTMLSLRLLGGFHPGFVMLETPINQLNLAMYHAFQGNLGKALVQAAKVPTAPASVLLEGARIRKGILSGDPAYDYLREELLRSGGGIGTDPVWRTNHSQAAMKGFRDAFENLKHDQYAAGFLNGLAGSTRLPFVAIEKIMAPIFNSLVPNVKLGVWSRLLADELENAGGLENLTEDQANKIRRQAWDSTDNRLGLLRYDNLHWNRSFKDAAQLAFQSLGWNLGYREFAGSAMDTQKAIRKLVTGKGWKPTERMFYPLSVAMITGAIGGTLHYLMTGRKPASYMDYMHPSTGQQDDEGREIRVNLPTYWKDLEHWRKDPVGTITGKLNPLFGTVAELGRNRDWYGVQIYNPNDPGVQEMKDIGKFMQDAFTPYSIQNIERLKERGLTGPVLAGTLVGVTPVPRKVEQTPAEEMLSRIQESKRPVGGRTKAQAAKGKVQSTVRKALGRGDTGPLDKALDSGQLSDRDANRLENQANETYLQRGITGPITAEEAMRVWRKSSPEERSQIDDELRAKIDRSPSLSDDQKDAFIAELDKYNEKSTAHRFAN